MPEAIIVNNLGKRFRRFDPDRAWTFQEALFQRLRGHRPAKRFWVLRGLTFTVSRGQTLGLIGRNGAGKSTLLRLIAGVSNPDEGSVSCIGHVSGLLDLGVGFHPDLSGRENVFINGVIAGLTRREVAERYASIVDFAELREFINSPLRTYSSGMHMRLGFSVAIHTEPDILLIDEVLAVGDIAFQQKCLERIQQLKEKGCTIVLVSHDPGLVRGLCDEALWLNEGGIQEHGSADKVVQHYVYEMETLRRTPTTAPVLVSTDGELRMRENRFGSLELELESVRVLDPYEQPTGELVDDGPLTVELHYSVDDTVKSPIFGVTIVNTAGDVCYDTNSQGSGATLEEAHGKGTVAVRLDELGLKSGRYFVEVGAYEHGWAYAYDYHARLYPLTVRRHSDNKPCNHDAPKRRATWSIR
jgi:lipopolysaccharide transport system ATP-binding protein